MSEFRIFVANFVDHFVDFPKIRGHTDKVSDKVTDEGGFWDKP